MTDPLETDVRTLLADRAGAVTADVPAGEVAIAERLQAGGGALAAVVALRGPARETRRLVMAAAVVLLVAIAGIAWAASRDDEQRLVTDPPVAATSIFTATGASLDVARAYLVDRLEMDQADLVLNEVPRDAEDPADLTAVSWSFSERRFAELPNVGVPVRGIVVLRTLTGGRREVVEAYSDGASIDQVSRTASTITAHTTGPAGSYVQLSVHRLDGGSITAGGCGGPATGTEEDTQPVGCDLVNEPIPFGDEAVTVRLSVVTADGERLTLEERLVPPSSTSEGGEATVTTATSLVEPEGGDLGVGQPNDSAKDVAERVMREVMQDESVTMEVGDRENGDKYVTMETSRGAEVTAFVTFDEAIGRFRLVGLQTTKFEPFGDAGYVSIPDEGRLTIARLASLDADLELLIADLPIDHPGTDHGPFELPDDGWLWMTLATNDGRFLYHLSPR